MTSDQWPRSRGRINLCCFKPQVYSNVLIAATGNRCQRENKFISGSPTLHCGGQRRRRPDPLTPHDGPAGTPALALNWNSSRCTCFRWGWLSASVCPSAGTDFRTPTGRGLLLGVLPAPRAPCLSSGKALSQNAGGLEAPSYTAGPQLGSQAGQRDLGPDSVCYSLTSRLTPKWVRRSGMLCDCTIGPVRCEERTGCLKAGKTTVWAGQDPP